MIIAKRLSVTGVYAVNLMSAPGAGKTTVLEKTIERLKDEYRLGVIEGDSRHHRSIADRIAALGVPAYQITTGSVCHLDARMVHNAIHKFEIKDLDQLFIEKRRQFSFARRSSTLGEVGSQDHGLQHNRRPAEEAKENIRWCSTKQNRGDSSTRFDLLPYSIRFARRAEAKMFGEVNPWAPILRDIVPNRGRTSGMDQLVPDAAGEERGRRSF
jgi:hypothetical protein